MSPFHKVSLKPKPWWESQVRKVLVNPVGKYQKGDSKESVALSKTSKIAYEGNIAQGCFFVDVFSPV